MSPLIFGSFRVQVNENVEDNGDYHQIQKCMIDKAKLLLFSSSMATAKPLEAASSLFHSCPQGGALKLETWIPD